MDEETFFDKIEQFFALQNKQRQRGLNNYNLLTTVLSPFDEVRLHSRMLHSLLDPNGKHFQGSLFLERFLQMLKLDYFEGKLDNCIVKNEHKKIDLYITDGTDYIIIENKIYAGDQEKQIEGYVESVKKENSNIKAENLAVVYLSLGRKKPIGTSLGKFRVKGEILVDGNDSKVSDFRSIHYKKEIMDWLVQCRHEVQNITNLNHAIEQYMDVVRMINNEYKGKAMSLTDYLKNHKELYSMAMEVSKAMPKVRNEIAKSFFDKVVSTLSEKLGNDWVVDNKGDLSSCFSYPIKIYKRGWDKRDSLIIGAQFQNKDFYNCILGVFRRNKDIRIKGEGGIDKTFEKELQNLGISIDTNDCWLHKEKFPNGDFIKYINDKPEENMVKFVNKLFELTETFETNELLTSVNNHLSNTSR